MNYKVIKSDLFLKGKIIPENSEVDLSENEIIGIEDFLLKCHPEPVEGPSDPDLSGEESKINSIANKEDLKIKKGKK
ncbi:MAG: hypothetical protein EHM47_13790 [Ignavibacteriales bacterium]|nr:MAG: hypothetical protein EHM47_13790 [Ignavibacteriales bacterium]